MSWMAKLYDTYEQAMKLDLPEDKLLMPISHTLQNAHINIQIDASGNFISAKVLEKKQIVLPATEKSAGRSSGEAPHPLADKLQYIAADYAKFGGKKKHYFDTYKELLQSWSDSAYSHHKLNAVLNYVSRGEVIEDLVRSKVCFLDENDELLTSWPFEVTAERPLPLLFKVLPKESGKLDQGNALVCWSVVSQGDVLADTWKDVDIQQAWIDFETKASSEPALCYVSGRHQAVASNHPAKLRHTGDKAKLVSANDSAGFTFRGRFVEGGQVANVGFEVTQKAHNALRWLIANHGNRNGDQVVVSWAVSGQPVPELLKPTLDLDNFDEMVSEGDSSLALKVDITDDLGQNFAKALNRYMAGYFDGRISSLKDSENIVIMGLDSATPGRMAITYYRDFIARDYVDRLTRWHLHLAWPQRVSKEYKDARGKTRTKVDWVISAPSPWSILQASYGEVVKSNEELKKGLYERLMPCIVEGCMLPIDIVNLAVKKASNRHSNERWEWEKNLGTACALFRGFHHRDRQPDLRKQRDYAMALDIENRSRDYLYGRLLAIAEKIEDLALQIANVNRPTNAARLMQRFSGRPFSTWKVINDQLQPYMQQLQVSRTGALVNLKKDLDDVMGLFEGADYINDKPLSGEYLLGFHCQRLAFRKKQNESSDTDSNPIDPE